MWLFKYLKCLLSSHLWVGSRSRYCLRCGKTDAVLATSEDPVNSSL